MRKPRGIAEESAYTALYAELTLLLKNTSRALRVEDGCLCFAPGLAAVWRDGASRGFRVFRLWAYKSQRTSGRDTRGRAINAPALFEWARDYTDLDMGKIAQALTRLGVPVDPPDILPPPPNPHDTWPDDDVTDRVLCVVIEALLRGSASSPAILHPDGTVETRPHVIAQLWPDARVLRGYQGRDPSTAEIAQKLEGAGLRKAHAEAWLRRAQAGEIYDPAELARAIAALTSDQP